MNPMYEFTDSEIGLLDMALQVIADRIEMAREHGATPPDGLVEAIKLSKSVVMISMSSKR